MAVEARRGCGFRTVGGLYLCGEYTPVACDRLPLEVGHCPVCNAGIHFARSYTKINPFRLWGVHDYCTDQAPQLCKVCSPADDVAFIMMVGVKYYPTPEAFTQEALAMGVSKRIAAVPKELKVGKTVVYLAHPKAIQMKSPAVMQQALAIVTGPQVQERLVETEKVEYRLGVFAAFIPHRLEKIITDSQATPETLEKLSKQGITPVIVPDGDKDHR